MRSANYKRISIADATTQPQKEGFYRVIKDSFWAVDENDNILLYKGYSPQCNRSENIVESICSRDVCPGIKVVYLANVWIEIDPCDYN